MTKSVVDYEYLMNTSFSDTNKSVSSGVRPRWERKQRQQQQHSRTGSGGSVVSGGSGPTDNRNPLSSYNQRSGDRFIPNRAGMNVELSKHMLRGHDDGSGTNPASSSSSGGAGGTMMNNADGGNHNSNQKERSTKWRVAIFAYVSF